ncbi:hypothetical protein BKA80DRAFT_117443 [Phyllosticta citrichinensis]
MASCQLRTNAPITRLFRAARATTFATQPRVLDWRNRRPLSNPGRWLPKRVQTSSMCTSSAGGRQMVDRRANDRRAPTMSIPPWSRLNLGQSAYQGCFTQGKRVPCLAVPTVEEDRKPGVAADATTTGVANAGHQGCLCRDTRTRQLACRAELRTTVLDQRGPGGREGFADWDVKKEAGSASHVTRGDC